MWTKMNAINSDNEMKDARRLLGLPECNLNSNIYIFSKNISSNGIFLFNPPEEYQLYFLLQGRMDIHYKNRRIHIPEEKLFFLSGKESIHFKSDSECLLLIVCFREVMDTVNMTYLKRLSVVGKHKITQMIPFLPVSEKIKTFALKMSGELSNERIYPTTLELLFTFLRAFFTPLEMATLFHDLVIDVTYTEKKDSSVALIYQTIDLHT